MTKKIFILIMIFISFYGCAITTNQKKAVDKLGQASESLGLIISKQLPLLRKDTIEMNMISLELKGAIKPDNLDSNFDNETIHVRVRAANALSNYGKLLLSLVRDDQTNTIKKHSEELFTNINRFNKTASTADFDQIAGKYTKLTGKPFFISSFDTKIFLSINESIQGLGGIFQKATLFYYNRKKVKCLKKIVYMYKNEINKICYLLMNDFSEDGKGLIRDYKNSMDTLENSVSRIRFIKDCCNRKTAVKGYYLLLENKTKMNSVVSNVESTLKALIDANNTLARFLENKKLSDLSNIKSLTTTIKDLAESIKIIAQ